MHYVSDLFNYQISQFYLKIYHTELTNGTGQLHKGDAGNGLFIQIISNVSEDLPIPDNPGEDKSSFTFGVLKTAQAFGDRQALIDNKRKVLTINIGGVLLNSLHKILA